MSAADVLAQHQVNQWAQHDGWWGCTCDGDVKCDAQHQLDALKAAGYAVINIEEFRSNEVVLVHLPRGVVNPDAWANQSGGVTQRHHGDLVSNFTREDARGVAVALLAAADAAEATS